jgi:hypothetical protein
MPTQLFPITAAHHARFGDRSIHELRRDAAAAVGPMSRWLSELADQLERTRSTRLRDVPTGWGWTITLPDNAEQPATIWRK